MVLLFWNVIFTYSEGPLKSSDKNISISPKKNKVIHSIGSIFAITPEGHAGTEPYPEDLNLSIYYLNEFDGNIFFEDENKIRIRQYPIGDIEVLRNSLPNQYILLGVEGDSYYHFTFYPPVVPVIAYINKEHYYSDTDEKYKILIYYPSGFPDDLVSRMYTIKEMHGSKFMATVVLRENIDFLKPFYFMTGRPSDYGDDYKGSFLPRAIKDRETFPSKIMILNVKSKPFLDEDYNEDNPTPQSDFDYYRLPLDLSAYGVKGELTEDSPFKIEEILTYSKAMKKIAFVGRQYTDDEHTSYNEMLFLVPEEGGKPEKILDVASGHVIQDMLFSPEGYKLVLELDEGDLYELTFPGYHWEESYPQEVALTTGIQNKNIDEKLLYNSVKYINDDMNEESIESYLDQLYVEVCRRDIKQIETHRSILARYYLNTIYAYNGYAFSNKDWNDFYSSFAWYKPTTKTPEFTEEESRRIKMVQGIE